MIFRRFIHNGILARFLYHIVRNAVIIGSRKIFRRTLLPLTFATGPIVVCSSYHNEASQAEQNTDNSKWICSSHYKRFTGFASIEYNGEPYMTPNDFLKCVSDSVAPYVYKRQVVSEELVSSWLKQTPSISSSSSYTFRHIGEKGLISFDEYMFLISVLTQPQNSLNLAFKILDRDHSEEVDRTEFAKLIAVFSGFCSKSCDGTKYHSPSSHTTLMIHLFGKGGSKKVKFHTFSKFVDNLQTELLQLEFNHYSGGHEKMLPYELGKSLLQYSKFDQHSREKCLRKLTMNPSLVGQSIDFTSYKVLFNFLHLLDDFSSALHMFKIARHDVSKDEFQRAARAVLGVQLDRVVLETIFTLFDADGDQHLSSEEFIESIRAHCSKYEASVARDSPVFLSFKNCMRKNLAI